MHWLIMYYVVSILLVYAGIHSEEWFGLPHPYDKLIALLLVTLASVFSFLGLRKLLMVELVVPAIKVEKVKSFL